jgi:phospholipid transport system substrate-binding protein
MMTKIKFLLPIISFVMFTFQSNATAATEFVTQVGNDIVKLAADQSISKTQKETKLRGILDNNFAVEEIGIYVLGRYNRVVKPAEKTEYLKAFEEEMVKNYVSKFDNYNNETLRVLSERKDGNNATIVSSEVLRPGQASMKVEWILYEKNGGWRIYDIFVEGVSESQVMRNEYASIIQNKGRGVAGLIDVLNDRAANPQPSKASPNT